MTSLSQAIYEKDNEKLEEGYLHLESAYGFLVSLDSELYLQGNESSLDDKLDTYDLLLDQYSEILENPFSKKSYERSLELQKRISLLNQYLGYAESEFWKQRAEDFENIRLRNKNIEKIYWTLVFSFIVGLFILIYFFLERLKLEAVLEKQRLDMVANSRLAALGSFSAGIAHEINNPLTVIQWRSKSIKKHLENIQDKNPKLKSDLESIESNTFRIDKIIKSIKTLSKNAEKDQRENVLISSIAEQLNDILSPKIATEHLNYKFITNCSDQLIYVREVQIIQVLINLINNSIDAIKDLDAKWIRVSIDRKAHHFEISVTDSGLGIPKRLQPHLFNLFFTTKSQSKENSGIGLSLSHQIIKDHNGTLSYNAKSENTQFIITIPIKEN